MEQNNFYFIYSGWWLKSKGLSNGAALGLNKIWPESPLSSWRRWSLEVYLWPGWRRICGVPPPQSAPAPASCRPPLSTGFLRMRKEEFKGFAHLFLTNDCACVVPPPQSPLAPASCRPPPSTGFLRMYKIEFKAFAHWFLTNDCASAVPPPQSAPAPTACRPPPSTGFLRMRKENLKALHIYF